ncbi:RluA family pseudouridine synthase [Buchnera aphidicola (Formosaphis micheliae)]|uniref:RluA family pseudouridine synthase n=1 Tax=Buchnera aphidicola TaxID=9 RepID=UPI0031B85036
MEQQRIDNFLIKKFKTMPKSLIYKNIRIGKIKINKKKIKPKYKLKIGDKINVISMMTNHLTKNKITIINQKKIFKIKNIFFNNILYEDEHLLIINKPSGIAVHGGSGIHFGIIECIRQLRQKNTFLELVHRLDRSTSGILLLAKKRSALINLHQQLRDNQIKKKYLALVHGNWPESKKIVITPLLKIKQFNKKNIVIVNNKGKISETHFKIQKKYINNTLLSVTPITGRTHQIRVHTSHVGHPIVFDDRYGRHDLDIYNKTKEINNRLLLHANEINFLHPKFNYRINILAPLEKNVKKYLDLLL